MGRRIRAVVLVTSLCAVFSIDAPAADLYWTHFGFPTSGRISRTDVDTFETHPVIPSGLNTPYRIAIDPVDQKMYWTSTVSSTGGVYRANLDGSNVQRIIGGGTIANHLGLAIDVENRKVVWSRTNQLFRANLDGTGVQPLASVASNSIIQDVTVDPVNSHIYFSDWAGNLTPGRLQRINYDGSGLATVVSNIVDGPAGVAVDAAGGRVYWNRYGPGAARIGGVSRANLDGSGVESILDGFDGDALLLDQTSQRLYITTINEGITQGAIFRANLDGSGLLTLPLGDILPAGVAIPEPATAVLLMCVALAWRARCAVR